MPDPKTQARARFLLWSTMWETRQALGHLHRQRPRLFARGLANTVLEPERLKEVMGKLEEVRSAMEASEALDWDALEDVGLTGDTLEWKADLIYATLGKEKPPEEVSEIPSAPNFQPFPEGKPVWSRLFKYLKSLFQSLINAVTNNEKVRLALDFIREYIDCIEASLKFVQAGEQPSGEAAS